MSLALTYSPRDAHLYLVDFSGRLLTLFAPLPHVGAVILADETERLERLLRFLERELDARKERLARAGVSTLAAYRAGAAEPLPAIVVVVDNFPSLVENDFDAEETLSQIAREGGNLGVHLVVTASSPLQLRSRISNNITLAAALSLADRSDYSTAVGGPAGWSRPPSPVAVSSRASRRWSSRRRCRRPARLKRRGSRRCGPPSTGWRGPGVARVRARCPSCCR